MAVSRYLPHTFLYNIRPSESVQTIYLKRLINIPLLEGRDVPSTSRTVFEASFRRCNAVAGLFSLEIKSPILVIHTIIMLYLSLWKGFRPYKAAVWSTLTVNITTQESIMKSYLRPMREPQLEPWTAWDTSRKYRFLNLKHIWGIGLWARVCKTSRRTSTGSCRK